jgi:hypothetical protein
MPDHPIPDHNCWQRTRDHDHNNKPTNHNDVPDVNCSSDLHITTGR